MLARKACNVMTASNGNTNRAKPAYRSKSTASLSRQANLLTGTAPRSETTLESTCLEDDLNSTVLDPPVSPVEFNVDATLVSLIS